MERVWKQGNQLESVISSKAVAVRAGETPEFRVVKEELQDLVTRHGQGEKEVNAGIEAAGFGKGGQ